MNSTITVPNELEHLVGKFDLPTPEHLNQEMQAQLFKGASATTWDSNDDLNIGGNLPEFPMIVWLRGDEPWFSQFELDADAAMQVLGIKRSRLTQISGKELRVGRVRIDRYIKPVYRKTDVEQYLNWTRATASHQKSSDAIKIAVEQLQEQSHNIQTTLESITANFTDQIKHEMATFIGTTVQQSMSPLCKNLEVFESSINSVIQTMAQNLNQSLANSDEQLKETLDLIRQTAIQQSAALEVLTLQINQTSEKASAMEERLDIWDKWLAQNIKSISAELNDLTKPAPFKKKLGGKKLKSPKLDSHVKNLNLSVRAAPSRRKAK